MKMLVTLAAAAAAAVAPPGPAPPTAAVVGAAAPPFHVEDVAGRSRDIADLRGRVVVVSYWATWCAPCKAELAMLDRAYRAHRDEGLEVIAVTNERGLSPARLSGWTRDLALSVAVTDGRAERGYGPIGGLLPATYIIDRAGVLRVRRAGAMSAAECERILADLLDEPPPPPVQRGR